MTGPTRRWFLAGLGGAATGLTACSALRGSPAGQTGEVLTSEVPLPRPFTVPLPVPALARPVGTLEGADLYEITQREVTAELLPGVPTTVWGYDGTLPGPTLETRRGRPVLVRHTNALPVPTVVHLHGGHTPPEHDGWPLDLLLPADGGPGRRHAPGADHTGHAGTADPDAVVAVGTRDHRYPMDQRAAALWYHDHRMDFTGPAVYRGLFGLHLVRDDEEDALPLPRGERELPLVIADRAFDDRGELAYPSLDPGLSFRPGVEDAWAEGVLGDVVLVNGAPWPVAEVDAARYRLRILNAANARRLSLAMEVPGAADLPVVQVGSDGGLLAAPVEHRALVLAPGERCDAVVDFSLVPVGTEVTVVDRLGAGTTRNVLRFHVVRRAGDDSAVPERLGEVEPLVPTGARREFVFRRGPVGTHSGWTINDAAFAPSSSQADVPLGQTEVWRFRTDVHHPVHVHLDSFQVLRRGGSGPGPHDAGWKDTVDVRPGEVVDVAVRFTDHRGRYVVHCHNLEHEDMAMMAAFRTV